MVFERREQQTTALVKEMIQITEGMGVIQNYAAKANKN